MERLEDSVSLAKLCVQLNPVIPRKSNSTKSNPEFDKHLYKMRHLVENLFARLKHFRSIATRFEKLAKNFKSMVFIACSIVWLKLIEDTS